MPTSATARAPQVTRAQLEPVLARALGSTNNPAPLIFVRADPDTAPDTVHVAGRSIDVVASTSPLEIRAHVTREPDRNRPLVVLTSCDAAELGDDLIARALRRKIYHVDRWVTVAEMFGAGSVARSLSPHADLADALIEARPTAGYPSVRSSLLDLDTAIEALLRVSFELEPDTLTDLLEWAERPVAARSIRTYGRNIVDLIEQHLTKQFGDGAHVVIAVLRAQLGANVMEYALAGAVIHDAAGPIPDAGVRLDVALGNPGLPSVAYQSLGSAATQRVVDTYHDEAPVAVWLNGADDLLAGWAAQGHAWRSPVSPAGFEQRLARAAAALTAWNEQPDDPTAARAADDAIEFVHEHLWRREQPQRVERLRMAARLIRRSNLNVGAAGTLGEQLRSYRSDGAWLDRARIVVSQRDAEPTTAALCEQLTAAADTAREHEGHSVAQITAAAANQVPDGLIGVEQILERVVAPVASERPVLLVVLDGLSMPIFTDLIDRLQYHGWNEYRDPAGVVEQPVMAALPTVTEVSRTSLLCGTLRPGDMGSEGRHFPTHAALLNVSHNDFPPRLFHKVDLRAGGLDTLPADTIDATLDDRTRIVAVVLNNIDERLKDVAAPPAGWGLPELAPLAEVLDAARRAGRAVILTSDHGHILDRTAEQAEGGHGGERWRSAQSGPVADGEIAVAGPRVRTDDQQAVLPWREQLRYGPRRNGYHGGITLAELAVPLAVLSADDIDDWVLADTKPPSWWHPTPAQPEPEQAPAPPPPRRQPAAAPATPTLFDPVPTEPEPTPAAPASASSGIGQIVANETIEQALSQLRLDPDQVVMVLTRLDAAGGTPVHEDRLADAAGIPRARIGRFVTQLQRLVNIDGYGVIETTNGEVRFDRALLERQLGL